MIATRIITSLGKVSILRRMLHWQADRYPENSVVAIGYGRAADLLWRRHHRYVNGYWIGHYELAVQEALCRELRAGDTVFDVGAHAGFFSLLAARRVGKNGRCIAFEPSPENCASIAEQIALNPSCHCSIAPEAISDLNGTAPFSIPASGSSVAHLGAPATGEHDSRVKTITLDAACDRFGKPDLIKMDIEGGETRALAAASKMLLEHRPIWLMELHGPECEREVKSILQQARYDFFNLQGVALTPTQTLPGHFIARPAEGTAT
jgi:FkbM family methyltransferase